MKEDNVRYIYKMFQGFCSDIFAKCFASATFIISNFFIDNLLAKAITALFFLIIFDWLTGMLAVRKTGEQIKSSKFVRTPIKIAIYFLLVSSGRIAEYSLPEAIHYIDDIIIAFLTTTELISIIENVGKMGYAIPKKLLAKLKKVNEY